MHEFDLIPAEYRDAQNKRRSVFVYTMLTVAAVCGMSIGLLFLESHVGTVEEEAQNLRYQQALSTKEQEYAVELRKRKQQLQGQALLLESLRSGASVTELVTTLEQALLTTDVVLLNWHFRRPGIVTDGDSQVRQPRSFLNSADASDFPRRWESLTHMNIQGAAKDHAALSAFASQLLQNSTVADVKVQRSTRDERGVKFTMAVEVKTLGSAA